MAFPTPPAAAPPASTPVRATTIWTWMALLVALIGLAGSFYLTLGMDLIACPLCFYERTLLMGVVGVLLTGIFAGARRAGFVSLVALPLTVAGLGVAGFHAYKEWDRAMECPRGVICQVYMESQGLDECPTDILEIDTAPRESLTVYVLIFLFLAIDVLRSSGRGGFGLAALLGVLILGGLFAFGLIMSVKKHPPMPKSTEKEVKWCRPVAPRP